MLCSTYHENRIPVCLPAGIMAFFSLGKVEYGRRRFMNQACIFRYLQQKKGSNKGRPPSRRPNPVAQYTYLHPYSQILKRRIFFALSTMGFHGMGQTRVWWQL